MSSQFSLEYATRNVQENQEELEIKWSVLMTLIDWMKIQVSYIEKYKLS